VTGVGSLESGGMVMSAGVIDVAEADAHVVMDMVRYCDRQGHPEDAVGEGQRIEVAVALEERTGDGSPYEGKRDEHGVGDMGGGKEDRGQRDGGIATQAEAEETCEDVDLQDELLHQRPEGISAEVGEDGERSVERVEGVEMLREGDASEGDPNGGGDDPEGGEQTAHAEAVRLHFFAAKDRGETDPGEGDPVENALDGIRRPDRGEDQAVADGEFEEVASAG